MGRTGRGAVALCALVAIAAVAALAPSAEPARRPIFLRVDGSFASRPEHRRALRDGDGLAEPRRVRRPEGFEAVEGSQSRFALFDLRNRAWANFTATRSATRGAAGSPAVASSTAGLSSAEGHAYPPDVQLAVSPGNVVESVNSALAVFRRDGNALTRTSTVSLGSFFSTSVTNRRLDNVGDSRLAWDPSSGRWFALAFDSTRNESLLAVSSSADPGTSWSVWTFASGHCPDQPRLAVGGTLVIFTDDAYVSCPGPFLQSELRVVSKAALLAGSLGAQDYGAFSSAAYFAATPTQAVTPLDAPYLISLDSHSSSVVHFSQPTSPAQTSVPVSSVTLGSRIVDPPPGVQPGGTALDAGDNRIQSAFYDNGTIWFSAGEACVAAGESVARGCARLEAISTTSRTSIESRNLVLAEQDQLLYPALSSDAAGDLLLVFGYSSPADAPGLGVIAKGPNGGGFSSWHSVAPGSASYILSDPGGRNRWGDYFAAVRDPSSPATVWVAGESASGAQSWATTIAAVFAPASAVPTISYSTPSAIGVSATGATLLANVNPQGSATTYHFDYGLTSAYGYSTTAATLPAGASYQQVSTALTSLAPSTTYHFRVVATNDAGTASGVDQTFTTSASPPPPPTPTTTASSTTPTPPPTLKRPPAPKKKKVKPKP